MKNNVMFRMIMEILILFIQGLFGGGGGGGLAFFFSLRFVPKMYSRENGSGLKNA